MVATVALPDPKSLCHFCITSRDFVILNRKSSLELFLLIKNASYGPLKCNPDYSGKLRDIFRCSVLFSFYLPNKIRKLEVTLA